jgi:Cd2+/Zn2+-exporting ATPase
MSTALTSSTSGETMVFDVAGMDCGDCARSVERIVGVLPGVQSASVSFAAGTLTVDAARPDDPDTVRSIGGAVERAGYSAILRAPGSARAMIAIPWWRNRKLAYAAPALLAWITAFVLYHAFDQRTIAIALFAATIVVGGYPVARAAVTSLLARRVDMNALMSISVIGAVALGEWSEGGLVVVLFTMGTTLQSIAFDHTRRAIRSLLDLSPDEAVTIRDGVEMKVRTASLAIDDVIRVRPGDRIAADGIVISGVTSVNQSAITGESIPVQKSVNGSVFGGTVNAGGSIEVRVTRPADQSTLANIVRMVEEAQAKRAPSQLIVDRFASVYTPVVVVLAALIALVGIAFLGDGDTWIYRALVLLVVACPCALVISTPVSIVSAIGAGTRSGVLVKGGAALEMFGKAKVIAFDKTGTLTFGRPAVVDVVPFGDRSANDVLAMAAAIERDSEHPLGRAIIARALHDDIAIAQADGFMSLTGLGAEGRVGKREIVVGSDRLLREMGATPEQLAAVDAVAASHAKAGRSVVTVAERVPSGVDVLGVIAVADRIRPEAEW